ncbi:hypothetical protein APHAL10511_001855 [Amanita phalloides]|nr:hypothetical protein APHAL10511_001855 [Amanita phalloides]
MLGKARISNKRKPLATRQRTLLELFPPRKAEKSRIDPPETLALDFSSSPARVEGDQSDGIQDELPSSPVLISPTSTPGSEHIVQGHEEDGEPRAATPESQDCHEVESCLQYGSQEDPIVLDSPPPTAKIQSDPPKQLWSIFAARPPQPTMSARRVPKSTPAAPLPCAESQHVRGPQTIHSSTSTFARRAPAAGRGAVHDATAGIQQFLQQQEEGQASTLEFDIKPCQSEAEKIAYLDAIPEEHKRLHPAIDKMVSKNTYDTALAHQLWTDKWRPKHAAEVLGNEKSSLYLRDWLRSLTLNIGEVAHPEASENGKSGIKGGSRTKRRRVVRAVDKRERKRRKIDSDDEDDWIAYDDESEEEIPIEDELKMLLDDTSHEASEVNIFEQLTNTIVLTGPPGCGKTASVYACAEELDWEVFEVYPGIGKRNGASIENLIGEVGKNHLVRKAITREENVDGRPNNAEESGVVPRQSLVLLEEVDILFKEDNNFWPAVVNFIRDCKRPVICTCNDVSLVPVSDLPLQTVLEFEPCAATVAASYLQAVCCQEGRLVDREALVQLYEVPYETSSLMVSAPDLRRTIHRLQGWCGGTGDGKCRVRELSGLPHDEACWLDPREDWRRMGKEAEMVSYLDGEKVWCRMASERASPGYKMLYEGTANGERGDGCVDRGAPITSRAMRHARGQERGHVGEYEKRIRGALGRTVRWVDIARGEEYVYLEYAAYVRQMVAEEDAEEERWGAAIAERGGRETRNSRRYGRTVCSTWAERELLGW